MLELRSQIRKAESMKITKGKDNKYHARAFIGLDTDGKRIYKRYTAISKAEIEQMIASDKIDSSAGKDVRSSKLTVGEAVDNYIDNRSNILSPSTILQYRSYRKNHLQSLMSMRVDELTESVVQKAVNKEASLNSPKTTRNAWGLVQSSLSAHKRSLKFEPLLPARQRKEMSIPTTEQLNKLFEATYGTKMEIPILLAATCGMRRSEICALDFHKDIDYKRNKITIDKALVMNDKSEYVIKATKTYGSTRTIDCPAWVIKRIEELKDTQLARPNAISNAYERLRQKLGIDARFHDLRHYFASTMLALGVPDKYAMKRMGHSTPDMLKNVYQHIMNDKDEEFSKTISDYFTFNFSPKNAPPNAPLNDNDDE